MRSQRGLSGSVQVTLLLPVALGIFLLLLQWSLVSWADATALAAAQQGAAVSARLDGSEEQGAAEAREVAGNGALGPVSVAVDRGPFSTSVTVKGPARAILWGRSVSRTVTVPTERITGS